MTTKAKTQNSSQKGYFAGALEELGKVTWPTKEQTALLTALTIVISLLTAALIGVLDFGFSELYNFVNQVING